MGDNKRRLLVTLKRWMVAAIKWTFAVSVCVGVIAGFAFFKFTEITAAIEEAEAYPEHSETVEIEEATVIDYTPYVEVIGQAVSPEQVTLRNELPGRIVAVNYVSGSHVPVDAAILELDVSEEEARIQSAEAKAELSRVTAERFRSLLDSKAASRASVDSAVADMRVAEAEIATWESVVRKKTIRAPFAGVLGMHQFEVGQHLEAGTEIAALVGESPECWIDFRLPQSQGELQIGSPVYINLIQYRGNSESEQRDVPARVIAKDTVIASQSRSLQYRATVDVSSLAVRHNAVLSVKVPVADTRPMVAVSSLAVQQSQFGQFVYVLQPDNDPESYRAQRRPIVVEARDGNRMIVGEGLREGETIAVAGAFKLNDGLLVYSKQRNADMSHALIK